MYHLMDIILIIIAIFAVFQGWLNHKHHSDKASYVWWGIAVIAVIFALIVFMYY